MHPIPATERRDDRRLFGVNLMVFQKRGNEVICSFSRAFFSSHRDDLSDDLFWRAVDRDLFRHATEGAAERSIVHVSTVPELSCPRAGRCSSERIARCGGIAFAVPFT